MENKVAAVILAAGYSSRMGGYKPLLPFGEGAVIDRVISSLREAGVEKIVVVLGHGGDEIRSHLAGQPLVLADNPDYDSGMFSSVLVGVRAVMQMQVDAFFLTPVDCPLIDPSVLRALLRAHREHPYPVLYPVYLGKKGHPPLITTGCVPAILAHNGERGLKGALEPFAGESCYLPVEDSGAITDMDTPEEYRRDFAILQGKHRPAQVFVHGGARQGKSALLAELCAAHVGTAGGFYAARIFSGHECIGATLHSVREEGFAGQGRGRMFLTREGSSWRFWPEAFEEWCAPLLQRELELGIPFFLLDEVGGADLQCPAFRQALVRLLESRVSCVGVLASGDSPGLSPAPARLRSDLVLAVAQGGGRILPLCDRAGIERSVKELLLGNFAPV